MEEQRSAMPPAGNLFADIMPQNDAVAPWEKEWVGMPEFIQNDLEAKFSVRVNFETETDMYEFAKLVNQKITFKTQSIWFPKVERVVAIDKLWVDKP